MDSLCLKAGILGITPQISVSGDVRTNPTHISAHAVARPSSTSAGAISTEKPTVSGQRTAPWGFPFRYPLRSLWPRSRYDAVAVDDAVLEKDEGVRNERNGNWVLKILHVRSMWREEEEEEEEGKGGAVEELVADMENQLEEERNEIEEEEEEEEECDVCKVDDDDDDESRLEFDKYTFSKLLRRVSLPEARLYAKLSYLGSLAYSIPEIKPRNLLKKHGLRFVTSSVEKKEQLALKAEKDKLANEVKEGELKAEKDKLANEVKEGELKAEKEKVKNEVKEGELNAEKEGFKDEIKEGEEQLKEPVACNEEKRDEQTRENTAYQIASSAASYLHSRTMSILPFKSLKTNADETSMMNAEVASLMATTDSVTAVVAAKEEVKQAVADDLNSTKSTPCEWFICDDEQTSTRFFVIQGSESLASWQANLLFEPIQFEGLDVIVHRGIYEAAKGMYEQMLPEVQAHLKSRGDHATFRFTGHSLGGSLSLLVNLMLLIRGEVPRSSLLPVITFGAPSIMCGGDRLLRNLGLPRNHLQAITMHRDIVPRAFSCNYPNRVADLLKAVNGNFRNHPCLNNQNLLYAPMGEFLILQPDDKLSPNHHLLPSGSGLYLLSSPVLDASEAEKQMRAAQSVFLNSPHPLEILRDRSAYGSEGAIQRDHDMNSYLKSVRSVIRQELNRMRKTRREHRRRLWWPLVAPRDNKAGGVVVGRPMGSRSVNQGQINFAGLLQTGRESLKRFTRLVASQHMHLLVVFLLPARLLIVGAYSVIGFR